MNFHRIIVVKKFLIAAFTLCSGILFFSNSHAHGEEPHNSLPQDPIAQKRASTIIQAAPQPEQLPALGGSWSAVYDWPLVAVHAALLPNGRVLAWDATPDDADDDPHTTDNFTTRVTLWDPILDTHTATNNDTDTDLFCAGSAHLWDGRILFAGGDSGRAGANGPLSNSNIYNPVTNTWHRTANMNAPRWYSSVAALSNGEMLTMGGSYTPSPIAEVFQFDQSWRPLNFNTPFNFSGDYQWLQATPEGDVISFGPQNLLAKIDTEGEGSWATLSQRDEVTLRDYGSYAMYDVGKILVAGGGDSVATSVVIDTGTGQTSDSGNLNIGRRQHNLTILADGSVLATGGNTDGTQFVSLQSPALQPELWDPATGQWRVLNAMQRDRQYHSIALLMPDGTVLSAGGGICGDCYAVGYEERNAEIFSPPYLYNSDNTLAVRPPLSGVPTDIDYAKSVSVNVGSAASIEKAHLIKLGSTTHSENQDQRLVPLSFSHTGTTLQLFMPASREIAPPGHYMLFVVNQQGVPSQGVIVKLGMPLIKAGSRVINTLELGATDSYRIETEPGLIELVLTANADIDFQLQTVDGGVADNCTLVSTNSTERRCEYASDTNDRIVMISGTSRSDYQLEVKYNGQAIPEPVDPEPDVLPEDVLDTDVDGSSDGESDTPDSGTDAVKVGTGAFSAAAILCLLILLSIARRSRPYCYTGRSN